MALLLVLTLSGFGFTHCSAADIEVWGGKGGGSYFTYPGEVGGDGDYCVDGSCWSLTFGGDGGGLGNGDDGADGGGYSTNSGNGASGGGTTGGNGGDAGNGGSGGVGSSSSGGGGGGGGFRQDITNDVNGNSILMGGGRGGYSNNDSGGGGGGSAMLTITGNVEMREIYMQAGSGGDNRAGNGGGGGGGSAMLTITGNVEGGNIFVYGGNGGSNRAGNGGGGGGGSARLEITGDATTNEVCVESGKDGSSSGSGEGGKGGGGSFTVTGTLKAKQIYLYDDGGGLFFNVGTLDVSSGNTKLTVFGPDVTIDIDTIKLGGGQTLTVNRDRGFTFQNLDVQGAGATYDGNLNAANRKITFDLSSVGSGATMLGVTKTADLSSATIDFGGTPTLNINDRITLLSSSGLTWSDGQKTYDMYIFDLIGDGTDLILVVRDITSTTGGVTPPGVPTVIRVTNNNAGDNNRIGGVSGFGSSILINPVIVSMSANPILGGATLSIDAWSGDGIVHTYQWQVQQNGLWVDIPGATDATFDYIGLAPGDYTVRCIVWNSTGGETISAPVTFKVV